MNARMNEFGQPIGFGVDGWQGVQRPDRMVIEGRLCRIEPIAVNRHLVLFSVCSFAALREFVGVMQTRLEDNWAPSAAFFVVLPVQYVFIWFERYGLYSIFIPVYAFLLLLVVAALRGSTGQYLVRILQTQWALMICVFCASHVPALLTLNIPDYEGRQVLLIAGHGGFIDRLDSVLFSAPVFFHLVRHGWEVS